MHKKIISPLLKSSGVKDREPVILEGLGAGSEPRHPQAERERKKERQRKNSHLKGGRERDEQVLVFLVSTDTGIGTCDHKFCDPGVFRPAVVLYGVHAPTHAPTHTHTEE